MCIGCYNAKSITITQDGGALLTTPPATNSNTNTVTKLSTNSTTNLPTNFTRQTGGVYSNTSSLAYSTTSHVTKSSIPTHDQVVEQEGGAYLLTNPITQSNTLTKSQPANTSHVSSNNLSVAQPTIKPKTENSVNKVVGSITSSIIKHEDDAQLYHDIKDSNGVVTRYFDLSDTSYNYFPVIDHQISNKWIVGKAS